MWRIIFIFLLPHLAFTQELPQIFQDFLEQSEFVEENTLTIFYDLLEHPIQLNSCSAKDLKQLPFLTHHQHQAILNYRKQKGQFTDLHELQAIKNLDLRTIKLLLPFVSVSESKLQKHNFFKHQMRLFFQRFLEEEKEYINEQYVGNPYKSYFRYSAQSKRLNWGLTTEKDAGENWFDFNSLYANLILKNSQIYVGDYQLSLGQGLLHYQGFGFGKSAQVLGGFKKSPILRSHTSTRESHFLRGLAVQQQYKEWNFSLWLSSNKQDANLVDSSNSVTSIKDIGLHRTLSELEDRKQLQHKLMGGRIGFSKNSFKSSVYTIAQQWGKTLLLSTDTFSSILALGWDYSVTLKNAHFFGEYVLQQSSLALISGLNIQLAPKLAFSSIYRKYPNRFYAFENNAFGEQSNARNEKGLYSALSLDINDKLNLSFYSDFYYFPEQSYFSDSPLRGKDYFFQIKYKVRKKWQMYYRCQFESKYYNNSDAYGLNTITDRNQLRFTLQWKYILENFNFKSTAAWNGINDEQGYLMVQEMNYKPSQKVWGISLRYLLFDTPSYNSRIYVYEHDVMYAFSVPFHYGEGQRISTVFNYKLDKITLNLKLAQTLFYDNTPIKGGSVEGNKSTEIKLVLRWIL